MTIRTARVPTRSTLLRWGLMIIIAVFVVRLFYLQIIRHDFYVSEARNIQVQPLTILPERGEIYMTDGDEIVPLVLNEKVYTVFADPANVKDSGATADTLRRLIGGNLVKDFESLLRDETKTIRYRVLARNVSREQAELIKKEDLAGIGMQQNSRRVYPEGMLAAQTLGYVNNDGKGQYGLEESQNDRLAGRAGVLETVTDVRKIPLTIGDSDINTPAVNGDNLVLTVDRSVQLKAEELLKVGLERAKATKGSIVVMDPHSGGVIAMANLPTYDPAKYNEVEDYANFQNNVVSYPYENGSVIKALSMGAGLDSGAVTVNSTFADGSGCTQVDDRKICNVEEDPRQASATMLDTLRYSLNTGVVYIAKRMGDGEINRTSRDTIYRYFHDKYRFGQLTGIEQAGEARGTIIAPNEQEGNNVRYANMMFGQGMDLTMIQTTAAFSAEINGGTYYKPHLIAGIRDDDGVVTKRPASIVAKDIISPESSAEARDLIWQGRKTGFFGKNDRDGYKVGGKTGTSQVIDPKTGQYSDENSVGTYIGFGGIDEPRYVIMVRVDDAKVGGYEGTTAAGPIFNDMSNWMLDNYPLR